VGSSSIYKIYNNPIKLQEEFLFWKEFGVPSLNFQSICT
jgi:hypothetical protein